VKIELINHLFELLALINSFMRSVRIEWITQALAHTHMPPAMAMIAPGQFPDLHAKLTATVDKNVCVCVRSRARSREWECMCVRVDTHTWPIKVRDAPPPI
jgi:hypothetical protein